MEQIGLYHMCTIVYASANNWHIGTVLCEFELSAQVGTRALSMGYGLGQSLAH